MKSLTALRLFFCPCSSSVVFWVTHLWSFWRAVGITARLSTAFMQRSERLASLPHQKRDLCYSFNVGGFRLGEQASTAVGGPGWGKKNLLKCTALVGPSSSLSPEDQPPFSFLLWLIFHPVSCFIFVVLFSTFNPAHLWLTSHFLITSARVSLIFCYWREFLPYCFFIQDFQAVLKSQKWLVWIDLPQWRSLTKTWDSLLPTTPLMPRFTNSSRWVPVAWTL